MKKTNMTQQRLDATHPAFADHLTLAHGAFDAVRPPESRAAAVLGLVAHLIDAGNAPLALSLARQAAEDFLDPSRAADAEVVERLAAAPKAPQLARGKALAHIVAGSDYGRALSLSVAQQLADAFRDVLAAAQNQPPLGASDGSYDERTWTRHKALLEQLQAWARW